MRQFFWGILIGLIVGVTAFSIFSFGDSIFKKIRNCETKIEELEKRDLQIAQVLKALDQKIESTQPNKKREKK